MAKKQKIKSRFPSLKEKHLPGGFNWVGPGTEIYDRIGLKYKGNVGTEQYWLPRNKLDLAAFKHDLAYYANDNLSRIGADKEFIDTSAHTPHSSVADTFILSQLSARVVDEFGGSLTRPLAMRAAYSALINLLIVPPTKGKESVASFLLNPKRGSAPQAVKDWALKWLGVKGSKAGARGKDIEKKIMSRLFLAGSVLFTDLIPVSENINSFTKKIETLYNVNKKNVKLNSVFTKYKNYLKTVGEFNLSGEFVLTKKGDPRTYIKFFKEFQKYIDVSNKKNKEGPKYPNPTLNLENLQLTEIPDDSPIRVPLEIVEEFKMIGQEKPNAAIIDILSGKEKVFNLLDFAKTSQPTTTPRAAPKPLNPAITSILAGETKVFNLMDFAI
tara:strand:+ start:348 stop:1499 length:1152 start_codon:yes stop_codon:yes gene_type:complete